MARQEFSDADRRLIEELINERRTRTHGQQPKDKGELLTKWAIEVGVGIVVTLLKEWEGKK
jgi:hypothetical protein